MRSAVPLAGLLHLVAVAHARIAGLEQMVLKLPGELLLHAGMLRV